MWWFYPFFGQCGTLIYQIVITFPFIVCLFMLCLNVWLKTNRRCSDVDLCAPITHPRSLHLFLRENWSWSMRDVQERIPRTKCNRTVLIPSYSQQDAMFLDLFIKTLYIVQAVPPPIIRSTKLYRQLQVLSTSTAASCYHEFTVAAAVVVDNTWSCLYSCVLLMMGGGTAWNM